MNSIGKTALKATIAFLVGALGHAKVAAAVSILGDSFQLDGSVDSASIVGATGIAGAGLGSDDITATAGDFIVRLAWSDGDSLDVWLESLVGSQFISGGVDLTLSDLTFRSGGNPVNITGAGFNPNANGYLGYFFDPVNNPTAPPRPSDPIVNWTSDSVRVEYGGDWGQFTIADQPKLRFEVTAVPEPSSYGMLCASLLGGLGLFRVAARSRKQRTNI